MNSKVEKINEYLIANQLVANGRDIEGDPYNTMLVSVSSVHGLGFYIFAGDDPIVGCKCVLATEIDPLTPGLLLLLNKLSGQYKTHSYIVDEDGILCAKFAMFFEDDKFDAENLFGYCSLVDYHVAKDIPEIFALLGREIPEVFLNDVQQKETAAAQPVAEGEVGVHTDFEASEVPEESAGSPELESSSVSENDSEVNNID